MDCDARTRLDASTAPSASEILSSVSASHCTTTASAFSPLPLPQVTPRSQEHSRRYIHNEVNSWNLVLFSFPFLLFSTREANQVCVRVCSSPLRPSNSAANRGLGNLNRRKRSREPDDDTSSVAPPSSRKLRSRRERPVWHSTNHSDSPPFVPSYAPI